MFNTFEKVNGLQPGFRRNHAKGVCISGYFDSNGRGVALSGAAVFPAGRVPIIGRFALAGGQPYVTDAPHRCAAWQSCSNCPMARSGAQA